MHRVDKFSIRWRVDICNTLIRPLPWKRFGEHLNQHKTIFQAAFYPAAGLQGEKHSLLCFFSAEFLFFFNKRLIKLMKTANKTSKVSSGRLYSEDWAPVTGIQNSGIMEPSVMRYGEPLWCCRWETPSGSVNNASHLKAGLTEVFAVVVGWKTSAWLATKRFDGGFVSRLKFGSKFGRWWL